MKLSDHFILAEFISSQDPDQSPGLDVISNLQALCRNLLEPLRNKVARPLIIMSGWRSASYNASPAINGAPRSQHIYGNAADLEAGGLDTQIVIAALASQVAGCGAFGLYPDRGIVHVDRRPRINGKITSWLCDASGAYLNIPGEFRDRLVAAGAINLV